MRSARDADGGFTCLEVLLAAVVLAFGVMGMSRALLQARQAAAPGGIEATADHLLADARVLVRSLPRCDADGSVVLFGAEPGETRADDVDDLAGLVENGPRDRAGTTWPADWRRTWTVQSVTIADPAITAANASTALLRVQITVAYLGANVASETLLLARTP